jgi:hypothetical protein
MLTSPNSTNESVACEDGTSMLFDLLCYECLYVAGNVLSTICKALGGRQCLLWCIFYIADTIEGGCRLREVHTLKGHVESVVRLKGLDINTIQQSYTVWGGGNLSCVVPLLALSWFGKLDMEYHVSFRHGIMYIAKWHYVVSFGRTDEHAENCESFKRWRCSLG